MDKYKPHLPTQNLLLTVSMIGISLRGYMSLLLLKDHPQDLFNIPSLASASDLCQTVSSSA